MQIPAGYPAVPIELELPELDGKTPKMPLRLDQFFFNFFLNVDPVRKSRDLQSHICVFDTQYFF